MTSPRSDDKGVCVYCELPITGSFRGAGDGTGQRFAHDDCWFREELDAAKAEIERLKEPLRLDEYKGLLFEKDARIQALEDYYDQKVPDSLRYKKVEILQERIERLEKALKEYGKCRCDGPGQRASIYKCGFCEILSPEPSPGERMKVHKYNPDHRFPQTFCSDKRVGIWACSRVWKYITCKNCLKKRKSK